MLQDHPVLVDVAQHRAVNALVVTQLGQDPVGELILLIWRKVPKNSRLGRAFPPPLPEIEGRIAATAHIADRNANPASASKDIGTEPLRTCPMEIVNTTNVAPIRMLAFWSAMRLSDRLVCVAVRTRWIALTENLRGGVAGS